MSKVVGYTWKGRDVIKTHLVKVSNRNTERQQQQRLRFGMVARLVQANRNAIRVGFSAYTRDMTIRNVAMSYNVTIAVEGDFPEMRIDYTKVRVSMGDLQPLSEVIVTSDTAVSLVLAWADNSQMANAGATDQLMVSINDPIFGEVAYIPACATRNQQSVELSLPAFWNGSNVEVLLFLVLVDGSNLSG